MTHKVSVTSNRKGVNTPAITAALRKAVKTALQVEGVELPCEINVMLTDDEGIRAINKIMRQLDKPTDVLSFPMFDLAPGEHPDEYDADPETGRVPLGDMCISVERARAQAAEYGHSFEREICYLSVHSVLHLLGYDHMDEGEMKKQMRVHEEAVMAALKLER